PVIALSAITVIAFVGMVENWSVTLFILLVKRLTGFRVFLNLSALAFFFAALGWKAFTSTQSDARRRLRLLLAGMLIGFVPYLAVELASNFLGLRLSVWAKTAAELAILLFPVSLAYAVAAQRAMEVQVVIRHGLQ